MVWFTENEKLVNKPSNCQQVSLFTLTHRLTFYNDHQTIKRVTILYTFFSLQQSTRIIHFREAVYFFITKTKSRICLFNAKNFDVQISNNFSRSQRFFCCPKFFSQKCHTDGTIVPVLLCMVFQFNSSLSSNSLYPQWNHSHWRERTVIASVEYQLIYYLFIYLIFSAVAFCCLWQWKIKYEHEKSTVQSIVKFPCVLRVLTNR